MPFVSIQWGEDPSDQDVEVYEFDTFAERNAFLKGVGAADGWMRWEPLDWDDEPEDLS